MLQAISGTVREFRSINSYSVQIFLNNSQNVIELYVSTPWVIHRRDDVAFAGEFDAATGKFIAYAYANMSCRVFGQSASSPGSGLFYIFMGIILFWAILPLFLCLPEGFRQIAFHKKVNQATQLLYAHLQSLAAPFSSGRLTAITQSTVGGMTQAQIEKG